MTENDILSDCINMKRLQLIREYVVLQEKLVSEAVSMLGPTATEYDFEDSLAATIVIEGTTWTSKAHGLGVRFFDLQAGIVVDAHVGFIDAANAFDAWRLVQYCESRFGSSEDIHSWQKTLNELVHDGLLKQHSKYEKHYVIVGE